MQPILIVFFRWIHLATACIAVGGVFFMRIILPIALRSLDTETAQTAVVKIRRVFKMVIHTCILLFLISGTYNAMLNWSTYSMLHGAGHSLFGLHVLFALIAFAISLFVLAGKELKKNHLRWMAINLGVMFLAIAAASTLKFVKDRYFQSEPVITNAGR